MHNAMSQLVPNPVQAARAAYERREWADATELFPQAEAEAALESDDLEALVWVAAISARDADKRMALERLYAHHAALEDHEIVLARRSGAGFGT